MSRRKSPGTPLGGQFDEEPRPEADVSLSPDGEPFDRTRAVLEDLLDFADQGARLVARGKEAYDEDEMLRLAAEALMHKIGEAVARLEPVNPDLIAAHPEVHWRSMKGARNLVAHKYEAVDHEILWVSLVRDMPREAAHLRRISASTSRDS